MTELKPCPFCGSDSVHEQRVPFGNGNRHVICRHCFASGPPCREAADAVEGWNRAVRGAVSNSVLALAG
jgi:Lar family restriction alleviation protein